MKYIVTNIKDLPHATGKTCELSDRSCAISLASTLRTKRGDEVELVLAARTLEEQAEDVREVVSRGVKVTVQEVASTATTQTAAQLSAQGIDVLTREGLVEARRRFRPGGSGPTGMLRIISSLIAHVAALRGWDLSGDGVHDDLKDVDKSPTSEEG